MRLGLQEIGALLNDDTSPISGVAMPRYAEISKRKPSKNRKNDRARRFARRRHIAVSPITATLAEPGRALWHIHLVPSNVVENMLA